MNQSFTDYDLRDVRAAAILTDAYVAGTVLTQCEKYNQLNLLVTFVKGSLTNALIKIEFSYNNSTWFQEAFSSISTTTSTESLGLHLVDTSGSYALSLPINYRYIRVSAIGTGTATASSMTIKAVLARS